MGERPLGGHSGGEPSNSRQERERASPSSPYESEGHHDGQRATSPQGAPQSSHQYAHQQAAFQQRPEAFNMSSMSSALPDGQFQNYGQRFPLVSPPVNMYQGQNIQQFPTAQNPNQSAQVAYSMPYQAQYQGQYGSTQSHAQSSSQTGHMPQNQFFQAQGSMGQQQMAPQYYVQNQYGVQGSIYLGMQNAMPYGARSGGLQHADTRFLAHQRANEQHLTIDSGFGASGRPTSSEILG